MCFGMPENKAPGFHSEFPSESRALKLKSHPITLTFDETSDHSVQIVPATCGSGFWGALNFFAFLAGKDTGGGKVAEPRQY